MGNGFPDLVVGIPTHAGASVNILVEVKDGNKVPSARKLTKHEQKFFDLWRGQVSIVQCAEDAIDLVLYVQKGGLFYGKGFRVPKSKCRRDVDHAIDDN